MKKLTTLLTIILVAISLLAVQTMTVSAKADVNDEAAETFVARITTKLPEFAHWQDSRIYARKELHDPVSQATSAILYELNVKDEACGYLIVDADTQCVLEFSSGVSPFRQYLDAYREIKFANRKIIRESLVYCPGTYAWSVQLEGSPEPEIICFLEDTSVQVSLSGISRMALNETLADESASASSTNHSDSSAEAGVMDILIDPVHYKLISGVPDSDYYISCIPTAIGNVIGYWDTHGYPNLIQYPNTILSAISEVSDRMIAYYGSNQVNVAIPIAAQGYCRARYPQNFTVTNHWNPAYTTYTGQI